MKMAPNNYYQWNKPKVKMWINCWWPYIVQKVFFRCRPVFVINDTNPTALKVVYNAEKSRCRSVFITNNTNPGPKYRIRLKMQSEWLSDTNLSLLLLSRWKNKLEKMLTKLFYQQNHSFCLDNPLTRRYFENGSIQRNN